jgi:hypothetical protein
MVHEPLTAMLPVQVVVSAKSAALVPDRVTELMERLAVPVLVTVTDLAALLVPSVCDPKVRAVGERETAGAAVLPPPEELPPPPPQPERTRAALTATAR